MRENISRSKNEFKDVNTSEECEPIEHDDFEEPLVTFFSSMLNTGCPWLFKLKNEMKMSYYLWDVEEQRTVKAQTVFRKTGSFPQYYAISHT